jgi:hypothetical protein
MRETQNVKRKEVRPGGFWISNPVDSAQDRAQTLNYERTWARWAAQTCMAIKCPACGEKSARHQVARPEYDPVAPQFAGGIVAAFVFVLSRKRRFRCDRCGGLFYSDTGGSRAWLALWILFWVSLTLGILNMLMNVGRL